jgi:hypothetical protein
LGLKRPSDQTGHAGALISKTGMINRACLLV